MPGRKGETYMIRSTPDEALSKRGTRSGPSAILGNEGVVGSALLNRLGCQIGRVVLSRAGSRIRQMVRPASGAQEQEIRRQGYTVLEDFLPAGAFEQVRDEYWGIMTDPNTAKRRIRDTAGCVRETYYLEENSPAKTCLTHIYNNETLRSLLMCSDGVAPKAFDRGVFQAAFWRHRMDDGSFPDALASDHSNAEFHSDTFYTISKAFFYVEPSSSNNGAHRYVPNSHRLSLARLGFEYQNSVSGRHSSPRVAESETGRYGGEPITFDLPGNSLIVENTFGFHAAGAIKPGKERNLIYLQFRWPPFGRFTRETEG